MKERIATATEAKVAHLIHTMAYGGVETALINWLTRLPGLHYPCELICFANPGETEAPFVEAAEVAGLHVSKIPWSRWKPIPRSVSALCRIIRERKIQILHCHNTYADIVGLLAAKICRVQCVTTLYVWGDFGFKRGALQYIDRALLPFFDRITAHCEQTRQETIKMGFADTDVRLLFCGFDIRAVRMTAEVRAEKRARMGVEPQQRVLINVARFYPEKAHEVLLEAMREIADQRTDTVLWLLGVGPDQQRVEQMSKSLGLDAHVKFLGFRSDLEEVLALCDVMVHPSHMEGVPLAVLSGMAAGLPVVASRVGGLPEVVRHGDSGVLIPPKSPSIVARTVLDLLDDPQRGQKLGQAAQRFLREEYSLDAAAGRVANLYEEMLYAQ